jgi:subtilisin family serine protease
MTWFRTYLLALHFIVISQCAFAQSFTQSSAQNDGQHEGISAEINGELLVQLKKNYTLSDFNKQLSQSRLVYELDVEKVVSPELNVFLLAFDTLQTTQQQVINTLRTFNMVQHLQPNHRLALRKDPNDERFVEQDFLQRIQAPKAWNTTTGGLTANGDTIVVALFDNGCDINHPEILPNIWRNYAEKQNDGQDNDNNGFKDDYWGWNVKTKNDKHEKILHGTAVSGIIGAKGNNGKGIAGVNWNVKIMPITGVDSESGLLEGTSYILKMRRLYNQSKGKKGAFVVAFNLSLGIDNAFAKDYPLWCAAYDSLGKVGILGVASTANANTDVEVRGDMPTSCVSDFLIAVTGTDEHDEKVTSAAFGRVSIDLAAPAKKILTVNADKGYSLFQGTSASAPQVSGAVALLYSYPCSKFAAEALTKPDVMALQIKKLIMTGVDTIANLQGKTVTGGRLNISKSMNKIVNTCEPVGFGKFALKGFYPNPASQFLNLAYQVPTEASCNLVIVNILGQVIQQKTIIPDKFSSKSIQIDVSQMAAGVYIMSFEQQGRIINRTFLVGRK